MSVMCVESDLQNTKHADNSSDTEIEDMIAEGLQFLFKYPYFPSGLYLLQKPILSLHLESSSSLYAISNTNCFKMFIASYTP